MFMYYIIHLTPTQESFMFSLNVCPNPEIITPFNVKRWILESDFYRDEITCTFQGIIEGNISP